MLQQIQSNEDFVNPTEYSNHLLHCFGFT